MFVRELMSKCVSECTEDIRLEEVYELIKKCEHGMVVVVDSHAHRVPIGIVNERSICEQIIARGRNPRNLVAGAVMDSRIKSMRESDLVEAVDENIVAVVATDSNRQVCGVVTREHLRSLRPVARVAESIPARTHISRRTRVSEIPAFGWVQ